MAGNPQKPVPQAKNSPSGKNTANTGRAVGQVKKPALPAAPVPTARDTAVVNVTSKPVKKKSTVAADEVDGIHSIHIFYEVSGDQDGQATILSAKSGNLSYIGGKLVPTAGGVPTKKDPAYYGKVYKGHDSGARMFTRADLMDISAAEETSRPYTLSWVQPGAFHWVYESKDHYTTDARGRYLAMGKSHFKFTNKGLQNMTIELSTPTATTTAPADWIYHAGKITHVLKPGKSFTYTRNKDKAGYMPPSTVITGNAATGEDAEYFKVCDLICFRATLEAGTEEGVVETPEDQLLYVSWGNPENPGNSGIEYWVCATKLKLPPGVTARVRDVQGQGVSFNALDPDLWMTSVAEDLADPVLVDYKRRAWGAGNINSFLYSPKHATHDNRGVAVLGTHLALMAVGPGAATEPIVMEDFTMTDEAFIVDPSLSITALRTFLKEEWEKVSACQTIFRYYPKADAFVLWNTVDDVPVTVGGGEEQMRYYQTDYGNHCAGVVPMETPYVVCQYEAYYGGALQASRIDRKHGLKAEVLSRGRSHSSGHMLAQRQAMRLAERALLRGELDTYLEGDTPLGRQIRSGLETGGFWDVVETIATVGLPLLFLL